MRFGVTLVGRELKPLCGLTMVLRYTLTEVIGLSKVPLGCHLSLFGGLAPPTNSSDMYANAQGVAQDYVIFCSEVSCAGILSSKLLFLPAEVCERALGAISSDYIIQSNCQFLPYTVLRYRVFLSIISTEPNGIVLRMLCYDFSVRCV